MHHLLFLGAGGARDLANWLVRDKKTLVAGKHVNAVLKHQRKNKSSQKALDMCHKVVKWQAKCLMTLYTGIGVCGCACGCVCMCLHVRHVCL